MGDHQGEGGGQEKREPRKRNTEGSQGSRQGMSQPAIVVGQGGIGKTGETNTEKPSMGKNAIQAHMGGNRRQLQGK